MCENLPFPPHHPTSSLILHSKSISDICSILFYFPYILHDALLIFPFFFFIYFRLHPSTRYFSLALSESGAQSDAG